VPDKIHTPDVLDPDEKLPADLLALRRFAHYMDAAFQIPGTRMRVGIDALLGLIPGVGDVIGALLSTWIIAGALRHRVPARYILRMVFNVAVDLIGGEVPLVGDVFDFLYEENMMNMRLLEAHRDRRRPPRSMMSIALTLSAITFFLLFVASFTLFLVVALILFLIGQRPLF
jgi:hypothetical protein